MENEGTSADREVLQRGSIRGLALSFGGQALRLLISAGQIIVLSRILPPELFGIFGMTWAFLVLLYNSKDFGLGAAVIQKHNASDEFLDSAFWLSLIGGLSLAALVAVLGTLLAWVYGEPLVAETCVKISPLFAAGGVVSFYQALMSRRMQFLRINVVTTIAQLVGTGGAIWLALEGRGIDALVFQVMGQEICCLVLQPFFCRWRPRSFRLRSEGLLAFGGNISFFRFVQNISSTFDHFSLGLFTNPAIVGMYNRAQTLLATPRRQLVLPLGQVVPNMLARLQGDMAAFTRACAHVMSLTNYIWFAFLALLVALPSQSLGFLLGGQWESAASMLRLLAIGEMARIPLMVLNMAETQLGRSAELRDFGLWSAPLTGLALMGGAWTGGALGMSLAYALVQALILALRVWRTGRETTLGFAFMWQALRGPLLLWALLIVEFCIGARLAQSETAFVQLLAAGAAGCLGTALLLLAPSVRERVFGLFSYIRGAFRTSRCP